jgi:uncharacterized membrane protein YczE
VNGTGGRQTVKSLTWWAGDRLVERLVVLLIGMLFFGLGIALMARAELGLGPWAVLHDGIGRQTGLSLGTVDILLGVLVLVAWLPLRERPGPGTVLSAVVIGLATNVGLDLIARLESWPVRGAALAAGMLLIGLGTALYLSAAMGPGPRDGLMTGLHRHFGWRIGYVRTAIEISVLVVGALLGGAIGPGTIAYAVLIGPLIAFFIRRRRAKNA